MITLSSSLRRFSAAALALFAALVSVCMSDARAAGVFDVTISSEGTTYSKSFSTAEDFVNAINEVGFSFGFLKRDTALYDKGSQEASDLKAKAKNLLTMLRIGTTYLFSDKTKGFTINFGYTF